MQEAVSLFNRSKRRISFSRVFSFLFCTSLIAGNAFALETGSSSPFGNILVMGVYPHLSSAHLERTYGAIADELRASTGMKISFNAMLTIENFSKDLNSGAYDLVLLQPFDYVKIRETQGYVPLVTLDRKLSAVFTARKDSGIKSWEDFRGKRIVMPPASTAVSYLANDWLTAKGLVAGKDFTVVHETTHISCVQKVVNRFHDVCVTVDEVLVFLEERLGFELGVVGRTQEIPNVVFAAHTRVSEKLQQDIAEVLLQLNNTASGRRIIDLGRMSSLRPARDAEYDVVRDIMKRVAP